MLRWHRDFLERIWIKFKPSHYAVGLESRSSGSNRQRDPDEEPWQESTYPLGISG